MQQAEPNQVQAPAQEIRAAQSARLQAEMTKAVRLRAPSSTAGALKAPKKRKLCSKQHGQLLLPQSMRKSAAAAMTNETVPAAAVATDAVTIFPQVEPNKSGHSAPAESIPQASVAQNGTPEAGIAGQPVEPSGHEQAVACTASPEQYHSSSEEEILVRQRRPAALKRQVAESSSSDGDLPDKGTRWSLQGTRKSSRLAHQPARPQYDDGIGAADDEGKHLPLRLSLVAQVYLACTAALATCCMHSNAHAIGFACEAP